MNKLQQIASENDIFKILKESDNYVGVIYHPETKKEIERLYSATEKGLRAKLIRYIYSTIPMSYEVY